MRQHGIRDISFAYSAAEKGTPVPVRYVFVHPAC